MKFNSNLYQATLELASRLPKGSVRARKALFRLWRSNPSWDPWLLNDDGIYRLFYLQGSPQADTWWLEGKIHSATSTDLKYWQDTGVALAASDQNPWAAGRMLAGCALKENGTYYLFYSAAGPGAEFLNEGIGLATSTDGVHWQRHSTTELIKPSAQNPWYSHLSVPWVAMNTTIFHGVTLMWFGMLRRGATICTFLQPLKLPVVFIAAV